MKKIISVILSILSICSCFFALPVYAVKTATADAVFENAKGIVNWKKSDVGSDADGFLINDNFLKLAGTTAGDWFPIGLSRLGIKDNSEGYLAVISSNVQSRYDTKNKLDSAKATEWHRIALAILACGGNPRAVGEDRNNDGRGDIDLIADGTYNRVDAKGNGIIGKQGINGFIWGLIALDSMYYAVPEDAYYTRDDLIMNILRCQLNDGGWALSGEISDPDMTGMALQALAPYYNSEKEYTYINKNINSNGSSVTKKVRTAIDEAKELLSHIQMPDGDYISFNMPNSESCVQVIVALTSLGINIFEDKDFIKSGNTLYDGLLKYKTASGGFAHSFVNDADNPSAIAGEANTMASEQALYCHAAIVRMLNGERRLYDLRPEQSEAVRNQINSVKEHIDGLNQQSYVAEIQKVYDEYLKIDSRERSYVYNYKKLSELLAFSGIEYKEEKTDYNSGDAGVLVPITEFTETDKKATDNLPKTVTLKYRAEVLKLYGKIRNSFDFEGKQHYVIKLEKAKNELDAIQNEIDDIKNEIKIKLYPFDKISLKERKSVHELYDRYQNLSEYDRTLFETSDVEGLLKCKTQVDNLYTALLISVFSGIAVVLISVFVIFNLRARKRKKLAMKMEESDE